MLRYFQPEALVARLGTTGKEGDGGTRGPLDNRGPVAAVVGVDGPGAQQYGGEPFLVPEVARGAGRQPLDPLAARLVGLADPQFAVPGGGVQMGERDLVHAA